jgi:hypothetical protein
MEILSKRDSRKDNYQNSIDIKTLDKVVVAYPTTVLLARNGVVRYIGIGAGEEEVRNLENIIIKVMKEENLAN